MENNHSARPATRALAVAAIFLSAVLVIAQTQEQKEDAPADPGGLLGRSGETTIFADKQANFNAEEKTAVFHGNVRVQDAEFLIFCDKLTVSIDDATGGLRNAIAEGNVRVIQENKKDGNSPKATGRGAKLIYDARTGEAKLSGRPQVQQGMNLHIADDDATVMTLRRDGTMTTEGNSRTIFTPETKTEPTPPSGTSAE